MKNYFSIGEISKMANVSVQTLRHYDKLDLLKPSLVKDNGYRYYSLEDFYKLDFIRFYRNLDMPLSDIKDIIISKFTINNIVELLDHQQDELDKKIKALENQKKQIKNKNDYVKNILSKPLGKGFLNEKKSKPIIKFNIKSNQLEEAEFNFREVLNKFPKLNNPLTLELLYEIDTDSFIKTKELKFNSLFMQCNEEYSEFKDFKISHIEEGLYASVFYIDYCDNTEIYIENLLNFIKDNNLKIDGPLYEAYIASEFDESKEKIFMEVFVKVRKG